jgi:Protein of unknown function (DUF3617)
MVTGSGAHHVKHLASAVSALLIAAHVAAAPASDEQPVPKRKPGLWEITTVAADTGMVTIKTCIGPDDKIATPDDSGECSEPKAKRVGADVIVDVVCKKKFGKQIMSTAFSGDFNSRYHAIMKITYDPAQGIKNMGVILDGKYLGPECDAAAGTAR